MAGAGTFTQPRPDLEPVRDLFRVKVWRNEHGWLTISARAKETVQELHGLARRVTSSSRDLPFEFRADKNFGWDLSCRYSRANLSFSGGAPGVPRDPQSLPAKLGQRYQARVEAEVDHQDEHGTPLAGTRADVWRPYNDRLAPLLANKRIKRVTRQSPYVFFDQYGVESSVDNLSTGEQQVFLRAGPFIGEADAIQNSVVLIDEPELSLSPDWQSKILALYSDILRGPSGHPPQIIVATHSPFIVHSASAGKVIVLERGGDGRVRTMNDPMFPEASPAVAVRAFNLDRFVREVLPTGLAIFTEGKTDHLILETAWRKLYDRQPMPFKIKPGIGAKPLQSLLNNSAALSRLTDASKVVGLFDFDAAWEQWNGVWHDLRPTVVSDNDAAGHVRRHPTLPAWTMLLPVPAFRAVMASSGPKFRQRSLLSIEFMFPNSVIPAKMVSEEVYPGGTPLPVFRESCKGEFAEITVGQIDAPHFEAFRPLFDRLIEIHRTP